MTDANNASNNNTDVALRLAPGTRVGQLRCIRRISPDAENPARWFCYCVCKKQHTITETLLANSLALNHCLLDCGCGSAARIVTAAKEKSKRKELARLNKMFASMVGYSVNADEAAKATKTEKARPGRDMLRKANAYTPYTVKPKTSLFNQEASQEYQDFLESCEPHHHGQYEIRERAVQVELERVARLPRLIKRLNQQIGKAKAALKRRNEAKPEHRGRFAMVSTYKARIKKLKAVKKEYEEYLKLSKKMPPDRLSGTGGRVKMHFERAPRKLSQPKPPTGPPQPPEEPIRVPLDKVALPLCKRFFRASELAKAFGLRQQYVSSTCYAKAKRHELPFRKVKVGKREYKMYDGHAFLEWMKRREESYEAQRKQEQLEKELRQAKHEAYNRILLRAEKRAKEKEAEEVAQRSNANAAVPVMTLDECLAQGWSPMGPLRRMLRLEPHQADLYQYMGTKQALETVPHRVVRMLKYRIVVYKTEEALAYLRKVLPKHLVQPHKHTVDPEPMPATQAHALSTDELVAMLEKRGYEVSVAKIKCPMPGCNGRLLPDRAGDTDALHCNTCTAVLQPTG